MSLNRAVKNFALSESHRWVTALYASHVVGKRDGRTQKLAWALRLSVSQVENLAYAGMCYRSLRPFGHVSEITRRTELTHWQYMYTLWREWEFSPYEALSTLSLCARDGISAADMKEHILRDHAGKAAPNPAITWERHAALYQRQAETEKGAVRNHLKTAAHALEFAAAAKEAEKKR